MVKRHDGATYVFAVCMRAAPTKAKFTLKALGKGSAEVLGEGRAVPVADGTFQDAFGPWDVHLYKIR